MPRPARRPVVVVAHGVHRRGGMERAFTELVRHVGEDRQVVVVAAEVAPEVRAAAQWVRVPVPARPAPLRFLGFFALGAWRVARVRARLGRPIVHTCGAIVPNRVDVATVHYLHAVAPPVRASGARGLRRWNARVDTWISVVTERWCYRKRTATLASVSPALSADLAVAYPGIQVVETPDGVDAEHFRPDVAARCRTRRTLGVADDDMVVLFVGGDWDRKGLDLVLRALADPRLADPPVRLWVVGAGDARTAAARHPGLDGRVRWLGAVDDPAPFYAGADVFVLPSAYETFGLAAFEAAASGLPVVATATGAIPDLLAAGGGILLSRDAPELADALVAYGADPERRRRDGAIARASAARWTWKASVDAVVALYAALDATEP